MQALLSCPTFFPLQNGREITPPSCPPFQDHDSRQGWRLAIGSPGSASASGKNPLVIREKFAPKQSARPSRNVPVAVNISGQNEACFPSRVMAGKWSASARIVVEVQPCEAAPDTVFHPRSDPSGRGKWANSRACGAGPRRGRRAAPTGSECQRVTTPAEAVDGKIKPP